jgi:hypothetical protein
MLGPALPAWAHYFAYVLWVGGEGLCQSRSCEREVEAERDHATSAQETRGGGGGGGEEEQMVVVVVVKEEEEERQANLLRKFL